MSQGDLIAYSGITGNSTGLICISRFISMMKKVDPGVFCPSDAQTPCMLFVSCRVFFLFLCFLSCGSSGRAVRLRLGFGSVGAEAPVGSQSKMHRLRLGVAEIIEHGNERGLVVAVHKAADNEGRHETPQSEHCHDCNAEAAADHRQTEHAEQEGTDRPTRGASRFSRKLSSKMRSAPKRPRNTSEASRVAFRRRTARCHAARPSRRCRSSA